MKGKKGISPLIATVLIIGFTIVLAALVITWGTKLFKTTVAETEEASKFALACTTGLNLDVSSATADGTTVNIDLRNNNQDREIDNFRFVVNYLDGTSNEGTLSTAGGFPYDPNNPGADSDADGKPDVMLEFPVKKTYSVSYIPPTDPTTGSFIDVETVAVYPQFDIDGKLKACESPTTANVKMMVVGP